MAICTKRSSVKVIKDCKESLNVKLSIKSEELKTSKQCLRSCKEAVPILYVGKEVILKCKLLKKSINLIIMNNEYCKYDN